MLKLFSLTNRRQPRRWITSNFRAPLLATLLLSACATPYVHPPAGDHRLPQLTETHAIMEDGYRLPLSQWQSVGETRAIVLALHGLNEYSFSFDSLGHYLAPLGITVIAYDQRGFGNSAGRGLWHGSERLGADLVAMTGLLRQHYPDTPLYLLGESMGGAVALTALASETLDVEGVVLLAPAVWTRDSMPFYQRFGLWLAAHTLPGKQLTGEGLDLKPSDNIDMLRALGRDELVIKATRVDVLYGVSNLMDQAMLTASTISGSILFLYGEQDDIIPGPPTCELYSTLSSAEEINLTAITYSQGYHMLTRDLQAALVMEDISAWITVQELPRNPAADMRDYCNGSGGTDS